ncbi:very long-chain acyl-CoA synthetase, partial [Biomphalaria glabrata]
DPNENRHSVTKAIGNGLRQDIWTKFRRRFQIRHIYEFYGSTELPASCSNLFNVPGSVGRLSPLIRYFTNLILVRIDPNTNEPFRNQLGRCELIKTGEFGILLARLTDKVTFDGYLGPASDTSCRIIKDVLEVGDFYVKTDDVFTLDSHYNLYFKDRIGDSFRGVHLEEVYPFLAYIFIDDLYRWKGENVSTAEVSNVMNAADFILDTNVFGVEIPGCEGKAGMAAINIKDNEDLDGSKISELGHLCREKLPGYARPRFLRVQQQMSLTSTFKQQKTDLVKDGFNPSTVREPLYYLDRSTDEYKPLADEIYQEIINGQLAM